MSDTRRISLPDGTALNARLEGPKDAPVILFSNSVMTDLSVWDAQTAALTDQYRVLRYDQRGHGRSEVTSGGLDFHRFGRDVIDLLDALDIARCTYVGLLMGVPTGLVANSLAPHRFERFVAVDGISRSAPGREAFWAERRDTARAEGMAQIASQTAPRWMPGLDEDAPQMNRLRDMIAATPVEGFAAATHALASYDHSDLVPALTCPFLGIAGAQDGTMPDAIRKQFEGIAGARFVDIAGAGHMPSFQAPDAVNSALLDFLSDTSPASAKESH